ncbi:MAG: LysM peptidoglycan-binding domain-containing protein [Campylobacterales bacterium]|nr:LysM peptidoglycan-binding domain-containing protein [Campylobacterales bacterium]HEO97971.1 LysM peptidoglycan-binding domain-containing protein [Campylobacterota bacterium]
MRRFLYTLIIISTIAPANGVVECRVLTEGYNTCNPYSTKYLYTKEIEYDKDRKKLISVKSLSIQEEKALLKVIPVEEITVPYKLSKEPLRFKGSKSSIFEQPQDIVGEVRVDREKPPSDRRALMSQEELEKYISELDKYAKELQSSEEKEIGIYVVVAGDMLSRIAKKFNMKTAELREFNKLKKGAYIRIGQKLILPYSQEMVDAISSARYRVKKGDSLISIAKKFNLQPEDLISFNKLKKKSMLRIGKVLDLPLPHRLEELAAEGKYSSYGKRSLRVTATAYTSHPKETDDSPFLAAWNNRLTPGMKVIAVSRDLLSMYGMRNGTKVRIAGLPGIYHVRDKMNIRYRKRIDIYMGVDRRKALRWGRRSVNIYWD